jgi:hypothetical protein
MMQQTQPEGVAWLNPANLPAGCQVRVWDLDDDGQPNQEPVTLETRDTHTEMTRADAERLGRALLGAAHVPPVDARERLARHLWIADAGDPAVWDNLADHLATLRAKGENGYWLARGVEENVARLREQAARYVAVIAGKED